ncbi:serine/threonine-protein kinase [Nocardiopsis sp. NPDC057823]|uniref:serine/threonine-protein kinase n=1 Tax=Nocardiopsis sp. NPDC057823 TaxID=3346256 RepID=UPI00366B821F
MTETGQRVGDFRLLHELGSGGFGSVFLGQDDTGRRAAVKLLHPHLAADPQVRRYFAQELVNARRVQGFCLAEILDADPDPDAERPWIATEYIDGPTLAQAVREHGPRTGGDLHRLAVQTITALAAIHAAGVVHRDFKPPNILLAADGPRVIDFGIARALDADTASATRIGTLGYMAPEQIEGTTLGPAADLFAWGAVMVYAATGAEAFPGPTQAARINRVLNHPPQTGDLADPLLGIVLACTDKDPERRPTARQVWDMLLTGQAAPPLAKTRPLPTEPEDDEACLRRAAADGDTDAMVDLGALLEDRGEAEEAESWYRKSAKGGNTDAMVDLGALLEARGEAEEAESWYRKSAKGGNTYAMNNLAIVLDERGEVGEAESWYRKSAKGGNTNAMFNLGALLAGRGEVGEAESWYRRAIAEGGNTYAMCNLAIVLDERGEVGEAESWYRRAAEGGHTDAMFNLGALLAGRGEVGEAESWYRRAIAEGGHIYAMNNLGVLLAGRGEVVEAESWYRKSAEGGNTYAMNNLGGLLKERGEIEEAEVWHHKAAEGGDSSTMRDLRKVRR